MAVKRMPNRWIKERQSEFEESHPQSSEKPWVEIGLLRYLNAAGFPYVCDLFGIFRDDEFTYVATSLATDGDLFSFVERLQMEPGPEREGSLAKSDHSTLLNPRSRKCSEIRGKKAYQAPEMHTDISYDSYLSDDFALGVVLYAMALSDYPWISTRLGTCKLFEFIHMWGFREFIKKRTCKKGVSPRIVEASCFRIYSFGGTRPSSTCPRESKHLEVCLREKA
ncbi:Testis-specific serine/threonine-protein kinase 5 [Durusdinium trenchii]|uniref:Testis-specific serine/threonine-protein kinase 5 n=1 Tax=Durusdinium trenchii TaxID=1381693 RepID=A0ABP0HGU1_9DINO